MPNDEEPFLTDPLGADYYFGKYKMDVAFDLDAFDSIKVNYQGDTIDIPIPKLFSILKTMFSEKKVEVDSDEDDHTYIRRAV